MKQTIYFVPKTTMNDINLLAQEIMLDLLNIDITTVPLMASVPVAVFAICAIAYDEFNLPISSQLKKYVAIGLGGILAVVFYGATLPILIKGLIAGYTTTKAVEKFKAKPNVVLEAPVDYQG